MSTQAVRYLFFDYSRFALASKESLHQSFDTGFDKRATAWQLIKRYYSAFFAAHAVLRANCKGIAWIDTDEAQQLENIGKAYIGPNFSMRKGGVALQFDPGNGYNGTLKLSSITYGRGSHDDFWRYFTTCISEMGSELLRINAPDASDAVSRFDELRRIILAPS
jgi:hypothetical protein